MSEEAAGYQAYAKHLGKLRQVYTGPDGGVAIVDGDGGSSPAQRRPWAAEDEYTYPRELQTSGACIADLERKVTALEQLTRIHGAAIEDLQAALALALSEGAALRDQVRELQTERVAMLGEH